MKTRSISTELLQESEIPKAFWKFGADTYSGSKDALLQAKQFVENFSDANGVCLLFHGKARTFKTFLSTYILKCLLVEGHSCLYTDSFYVVQTYMGKFSFSFDAKFGMDAACLAIDGLPRDPKDVTKRALTRLVTLRADNALPCVFTTTLEPNVFEQVYIGVFEKIRHLLVSCECHNSESSVLDLTEEARNKIRFRRIIC